MDAVKILSHNGLTSREVSTLFNLAEFEIYENYLHIYRLQVYGSYQEEYVRPKRFIFVVEHSGVLELKVGGSYIPYRFSEGDLITIEKGFKHRWIGNPLTLLVINYEM
jgi:hypothetical protein